MKKLIVLCIFGLVLLLSTQTVAAQQNTTDKKLINQVEALQKSINFNDNQAEELFKALKTYTNAVQEIESKAFDKKDEALKKLKTNFEEKVSAILTEEQFDNFISSIKL